MNKDLSRAAGRYSQLKRGRSLDDPVVVTAHRDLATARIAEHAAEVMESCPPLLPDQVERIARVLGGEK